MTTATKPPGRPAAGAGRNRAAQERRKRRRLALYAAVASVFVAVGAIVIVAATSSGPASTSTDSRSAPASVLNELFGVPAATLDGVGLGTVAALPRAVNEPARTRDGKPLVLYLGAEYCPYCAAERWPLIQAMSRFGTFTNLRTTTSAAGDVHPNTPTFTFHGVTYRSDYLAFAGRELYTNQPKGSGYGRLDAASPEEMKLLQTYGNAFPLVDMGGRYVIAGATYDSSVLHGQTWQTIADAMLTPTNPIARAVDGSANVITATLCTLTNQQPASVCAASGVKAAASALHG